MQAFTAMELEAARRREVFSEELTAARQARRNHSEERATSRRDLSSLATSAATAGRRLVRG